MDSRTGIVVLVVLGWYGAMSAVSIAMYWWDKRASGRGGWRTREASLLTVDLLGGWPGGWIARRALRHKTRKLGYRARFYAVVTLHAVAWGVVLWLVGRGRGWWG